jgi:hypothetical protein
LVTTRLSAWSVVCPWSGEDRSHGSQISVACASTPAAFALSRMDLAPTHSAFRFQLRVGLLEGGFDALELLPLSVPRAHVDVPMRQCFFKRARSRWPGVRGRTTRSIGFSCPSQLVGRCPGPGAGPFCRRSACWGRRASKCQDETKTGPPYPPVPWPECPLRRRKYKGMTGLRRRPTTAKPPPLWPECPRPTIRTVRVFPCLGDSLTGTSRSHDPWPAS